MIISQYSSMRLRQHESSPTKAGDNLQEHAFGPGSYVGAAAANDLHEPRNAEPDDGRGTGGHPKHKAVVSRRDAATWFDIAPGERMAIHVPSRTVGGAFCLLELNVSPGNSVPLHYHGTADEVFFVLSGTVRFTYGGDRFDAPAGASVVIPRGAHHAFMNATEEPASMLVLFAPGGMEHLFPQLAEAPTERWSDLAWQYDSALARPPPTD
jgi:mannose-6-phosphate isomerase-like protein (cupin superfamily)